MTDEARALPADDIRVFRGQDRDLPKGLSWTLDRAVGEDFAREHRKIYNLNPVTLVATIARADIAFAVADR